MAFTDSSWVQVQAFIDGAWVNITADTDDVDGGGRISGSQGVTIKRGNPRGARRANAGECNFTIFNRDGKYSSRNPRSPYWGLLPLNTPLRVLADPYEGYLRCESANINGSIAATGPDSAALDITGDMELRLDFEPDQGTGVYYYTTVTKYQLTGNQRSWFLSIEAGYPSFKWSPDGTFASLRQSTSTAPLPEGRISLKVQFDANNGAGGVTVKFYTATSIDGTYTQLGSDVVSAGTSSLFSGSAPVTFTAVADGTVGIVFGPSRKFQGKIFQFRMYSNLTGTLAGKADFTGLEPGETSYNDGTTTWSITSPGYIASDKIRFYGTIPRWPVAAAVDGTNKFSAITAYGLLQNLSQDSLTLNSAMYDFYVSVSTLVGYWPCEDGADSTQLSSALTGGRAATATEITYEATDTLPGSRSVINITETSRISGTFISTASTGVAAFTVAFFFDVAPAVDCDLFNVTTSTGVQFKFTVGATAYTTRVYNADGVLLSSSSTAFGTGAEPGNWVVVVIELAQSGADISWVTNWRLLDPAIGYAHSGTAAGATLGRLSSWTIPGLTSGHGTSTVAIGHIAGDSQDDSFLEADHLASFRGYVGETEIARLVRLCAAKGITMRIQGNSDRATPMGVQGASNTLLAHLEECAEAGRGLLYESRFDNALMYMMRSEMEQYYTRTISYTSGAFLSARQDDDLEPVNYVTVTRTNGGSSTAITETGARSITAIGIKSDPQTLNLEEDTQTRDVAGWIRHVGSWDQESWLDVELELAKPVIQNDSTLLAHVHGLDLGKGILITNPPDYLPVREPECFINEYIEVLTRHSHSLVMQTSPAAVFHTASFIDSRVRVSSNASYLTTAIDDNDVSFSVSSDSPYTKWAYPSANFYLAVSGGKERMTVTAISGTGPWTFTVTRGNPAFSHAANADVRLWDHRVIGY